MHPEVQQSAPGKGSKCGIVLVKRSQAAHTGARARQSRARFRRSWLRKELRKSYRLARQNPQQWLILAILSSWLTPRRVLLPEL
jgi:hypothetical protein